MTGEIEIALIGMVGSIVSSALAAAAVYLGTINKDKLTRHDKILERVPVIEGKVDGQLSKTIALEKAVSFSSGEDKQRDKQEIKDALAARIKAANGEQSKENKI